MPNGDCQGRDATFDAESMVPDSPSCLVHCNVSGAVERFNRLVEGVVVPGRPYTR